MSTGFSVAVRIEATPAQVFWFLADPATAPVIDPAVLSYEPEGGIMGLGVVNHIRLRMLGCRLRVTSETVAWEPGALMVFRSVKPGRPVVAIATHRFDASIGGAIYTWSMEFVPTGVGGQLAAALSARLFEQNATVQQARVRTILEAARRPPPMT